MAPPPITPSPHRFITSKPANGTAKPSSLRFQQVVPQSASSQQFTPAPKFNFSSTQKPDTENATAAARHASPLSRRLHLPAGTRPNKNREDTEETVSDNEETEGLDNDGSIFALPTIPTSKRRRPNPPDAVIISSDSSSPSTPPTTPPYPTIEEDEHEAVPYNDPNPHIWPRFVLPTPKPTVIPSISSRPPLILPPRSPSPTITIPAFFSPHRRGQRYIPGGLASSVRDCIVEASQQAHNKAHARRGEEEFWSVKFRVGDCRVKDPHEGMILVQERNEAKRWMLMGKERGGTTVEVGCIVGVREPTWEVLVGHELYRVAIEWKVLNG